MLMAGSAGATGAFVGTPAEVALVRMTTDGRLPVGNVLKFINIILYVSCNRHCDTCVLFLYLEQRRNYKNVIDAFIRIVKEEGVLNLWRGSIPTVGRAIVVNVSQLATYSQVKYMIASRCTFKNNSKYVGIYLQKYCNMFHWIIYSQLMLLKAYVYIFMHLWYRVLSPLSTLCRSMSRKPG